MSIQKFVKRFLLIVFRLIASCNVNHDKRIIDLLNSDNNEDNLIKGAIKAGESGDRKYVPLLLKNPEDQRVSMNFHFKGMTVYKAKMEALGKILKVLSPKPVSHIIVF